MLYACNYQREETELNCKPLHENLLYVINRQNKELYCNFIKK